MNTLKEDHFKNLVVVAYADGIIDDEEERMLKKKATEWGIKPSKVDFICRNVAKFRFTIPRTMIDRENQLLDAIEMATSDGELHKKEYDLLITLGLRLGYKKDFIEVKIKDGCENKKINLPSE